MTTQTHLPPLRPIDEVRAELDLMSEHCVGFELKDLRYDSNDKSFSFEGSDTVLSKKNAQQLLNLLKAPGKFINHCADSELVQQVLKYCASGVATSTVYSRLADGGHLSDFYLHAVPTTLNVFDAVVECRDDWQIEFLSMNGATRMVFVSEISKTPPKRVGDPSFGGVLVELANEIRISEYIMTLSCRNGMMSPRIHRTSVEASVDVVPSIIKRHVRMALDNVEQEFLPKFIQTDEVPLRDPQKLIHHLARHAFSSGQERQLLDRLQGLTTEGTFYDLIYGVTAYARDARYLDFETGRRLSTFASTIVDVAERERCNQCQRPLV